MRTVIYKEICVNDKYLIMKQKLTWISFSLVCLFLLSCKNEVIDDSDITTTVQNQPNATTLASFTQPAGKIVRNQFVVKFQGAVSDAEKAMARSAYKVSDFQRCNCDDSGLELWEFDLNTFGEGEIEEIKTSVNVDPDLESSEFQYIFSINSSSAGTGPTGNFMNKIKSVNSGVTIAVVDTGIEPEFPSVAGTYLYKSDRTLCYPTALSGWDFVDNDPYPTDSHGHGSIVSAVMGEYLDEMNIDFQILPIRAFDSNGKGSYFNIACGLQYAISNPDVDVINLSFGWYQNDLEVFRTLVEEAAANNKFIVASAGNQTNNNNLIRHYPSGYSGESLVAIGAHNEVADSMASYSNYGFQTVDFAAPGSYKVYALGADPVQGTSYSAAFVSARVAELISGDDYANEPLLDLLLENSTYNQKLDLLNVLKYPRTINP